MLEKRITIQKSLKKDKKEGELRKEDKTNSTRKGRADELKIIVIEMERFCSALVSFAIR